MGKPSPGWAEGAEARLRALEAVVLATLDPVQRERYGRQVEENLKAFRGEGRTPDSTEK